MKEDFMIFDKKTNLSVSFRLGTNSDIQTMSLQDFCTFMDNAKQS